MNSHLDALETRAPLVREAALLAALPAQIAHAQKHAPAFAQSLQGVQAQDITSRAALDRAYSWSSRSNCCKLPCCVICYNWY